MPTTKAKKSSTKKSSKGLLGSRFRFNKLGALAIAAVLSVVGAVYVYTTHAATAPPNIINYPPTVRLGNVSPAVTALQNILLLLGDQSAYIDGLGHFGNHTLAEVRAVQLYNHLSVDGIVGPQTWRVLFTAQNSGDNNNNSVGAPSLSAFSLLNDGKYIKLRAIKIPQVCQSIASENFSKGDEISGLAGTILSAGRSGVMDAASGPNVIKTQYRDCYGNQTGASAWATILH